MKNQRSKATALPQVSAKRAGGTAQNLLMLALMSGLLFLGTWMYRTGAEDLVIIAGGLIGIGVVLGMWFAGLRRS